MEVSMRRERTTAYEDARAGRATGVGALARALNTSESGLYGIIDRERWVETGRASRVGRRIIIHFATYAPMIGFAEQKAA
jgi:hypothetical protein